MGRIAATWVQIIEKDNGEKVENIVKVSVIWIVTNSQTAIFKKILFVPKNFIFQKLSIILS